MRLLTRILSVVLCAATLLCMAAGAAPRVSAAAVMTVSDDLINVVKKMEGFSAKPYKDNTQYSIGYGCFCPDDMVDYYTKNPITEEQAVAMLKEQIVTYETEVNNFAAKYGLTFRQNQFDALVSFTYNCGGSWTRETTGYFNNAVRSGDMGNAFLYGICLFSKSAGSYNSGLINRRMCEANMYINGVYKAYNDGNGTNNYPENFRWVFLDGGAGKVKYEICAFDAAMEEEFEVAFSSVPTGTDSSGKVFYYELEGWYTASGRKVEVLDSAVTRGETLRAKWKDPDGNILQEQEPVFPRTGTITGVETSVNIRKGPGTNYDKNGTRAAGAKVTILEERTGGSYSAGGQSYNTWGKLSDTEWVAMAYVTYDPLPVQSYTVKFLNWDGSVISEAKYPSGSTVTQPTAPTRPADQTYRYDFAGWDKEVTACTADAVYTAVYTPVYVDYTVTFQNWDGSVIAEDTYHYGDGVTAPEAPEKPADKTYTYAFAGWDKEITACTGDAVYTAVYTPVYIEYTVTFKNADGAVISTNTYHYGDAVQAPPPPEKPAGTAEDATFRGWGRPVTACTGDAVYTAVFSSEEVPGDFNGDFYVTDADALYLLRHTLFADRYPVYTDGDVNSDGVITDADALYLLRHTLFADRYPLYPTEE